MTLNNVYRPAIITGILFAASAVIIGAFAAHGLKPKMDEAAFQTFETGVKYQMYHSFALIILGLSKAFFPNKNIHSSSLFFILGILFFSGSLYVLSLLKMQGIVGLGGLGIITPIGGLCFITAWLLFLIAVVKTKA